MTQNPPFKKEKCVVLPDELWHNLLETFPGSPIVITITIRLFSGDILHRMVISDRGTVLGREAEGLAGAHGVIDSSMLTFRTEDIEAVQVPGFRFWQRPKWVALNPKHPARRAMTQNPPFKKEKCVVLPDELWYNLLETFPGSPLGVEMSVRLFSGEVLHRMVISDRGTVLGREAEGLAGYHGVIDDSTLTFRTEDIEAVQVPGARFWQRPKWVALNPKHPARQAWQNRGRGRSSHLSISTNVEGKIE
jgi:hypothetical protein